jgi:FecR protein
MSLIEKRISVLADLWSMGSVSEKEAAEIRELAKDPEMLTMMRQELALTGALRTVLGPDDPKASLHAFLAHSSAVARTSSGSINLRDRVRRLGFPGPDHRRMIARTVLATAATVVAAVTCYELWPAKRDAQMTIAADQIGSRLMVAPAGIVGGDLGDGVRFDAGPGTEIVVTAAAPDRHVSVAHGWAEFSVDPLPPGAHFSVSAGRLTGSVHGTRFRAAWDEQTAQITVSSGRVAIEDDRGVAIMGVPETEVRRRGTILELVDRREGKVLFAPIPGATGVPCKASVDSINHGLDGPAWQGAFQPANQVLAVDLNDWAGIAPLPGDAIIACDVWSDRPRKWSGIYILRADGGQAIGTQPMLLGRNWQRIAFPMREMKLAPHKSKLKTLANGNQAVHIRIQASNEDGGTLLVRGLRISELTVSIPIRNDHEYPPHTH